MRGTGGKHLEKGMESGRRGEATKIHCLSHGWLRSTFMHAIGAVSSFASATSIWGTNQEQAIFRQIVISA